MGFWETISSVFSPSALEATPLQPDGVGHQPMDAAGQSTGPYAHASTYRDATGAARGWGAGAGLMSGNFGDKANADVLSANANFGGWRGMDGQTNVGFAANAQVMRLQQEMGGPLGPIGFDVGALDAGAQASHNANTTSLGATASLIDGAVTAGTQEHNVRFGGAVGLGLGGRLHHGDADHDGIRELGFGFDAGPIQFDVKSELLGRAYNATAGFFSGW